MIPRHQIGVGDISTAIDRAKHFAAGCQEAESVSEPSLLPTYLGEKEHGLGLAVRVVEPPTKRKALFEAGRGVGESVLAPVGAGESGQGVDLAPGVAQLAENGAAFGEECHRLRQPVLEAAQVAQAAQQ
jgi:hypothetical protein